MAGLPPGRAAQLAIGRASVGGPPARLCARRGAPAQRPWALAGALAGATGAGTAAAGALRAPRRRRARAPALGPRRRTTARALDSVDVYGRLLSKIGEASEHGNGPPAVEPVVKVFCVNSAQRPSEPWASKAQREGSGTGFFIEHGGEKMIMTNAHVVADATYVEVKRAGDASKYQATRAKIAHECDLALLTVEDPEFWEGMVPLSFGGMPHMRDEVVAVGYPEGGAGISITQGVVSRIEVRQYAHSGRSLLTIQIDAAINPGNSGGPALNEAGEVIGVAFQNQNQSQNIGYVIPVPIITHFLNDVDPNDPHRCLGFCSLGVKFQNTENEQLRANLKLKDGQTGILICRVSPTVITKQFLQRGDVIMNIEGHDIANDGTFAVGQKERLSLQHLIQLKYAGEEVRMKVFRQGEELELSVPTRPVPSLVPSTIYDDKQPYFLYGGLNFMPLTKTYLQEWGQNWLSDAPAELLLLMYDNVQTIPEEQPVILSHVFPTRRTAGYLDMIDQRVVGVNGEQVVNLRQMYELVQRCHRAGGFVEFELHSRGGNQTLAIETSTADGVTAEVMRTYNVPHAASVEFRGAGGGGGGAAAA